MIKLFRLLALLAAGAAPAMVFALSTDREQPMLIEADRAERIDRVVLVGALVRHAADLLETAWNDDRVALHPELTAEAAAAIRRDFPEDGAVLLKGSRGLRLERVLTADVLQPAPSD